MQDKHRPCQDGMFFRHNVQNLVDPSLGRAQRWTRHEGTSVQQYACNCTESRHDKTKMCDLVTRREFSCLQDFLDLCSIVLQYKTKHSRGNVIKHALTFLISEYNWLHFTTTEGRGNVHANTAASINTKKNGLHPTTDSALRPIVLMVVNILHSSTNGTDGCCAFIKNMDVDSRCPEVGRKNDAHQPRYMRERATKAAFATRKDTSASKTKNLLDKAAGRIIEIF